MFKKSAPNIALVSIGNVLNAALGFLFLTAVAKTLSVENFGVYALLSSLLVFFSKIIDFGTNSVFVADSIIQGKTFKDQFFASKIVLFVIALLLSILTLFVFKLLTLPILAIFLIGLVGYGINYTLFAVFQKIEKFALVVILNTLPATLKGITAILIFFGIIKITSVGALAVFAGSMLSSAILLLTGHLNINKTSFSLKMTVDFLKKAIPAGVALLINDGWHALTNSITKVVKTFTDVGIFALANKIANIFTLFSLSIFTVLLPKNATRKKNNSGYNIKETFLLSSLILVFAIVAILFSAPLVTTVFGDKYQSSIGLLNILILGSALTAIHTFMENFFYIEDKTKTLFQVSLIKLSIFATFAIFLIPLYALSGLALAYLAASVGTLAITVMVVIGI